MSIGGREGVWAFLRDRPPGGQSQRVVLVATATDFLAVGAGIAAAVGLRYAAGGWAFWALAPFCAALGYVLVQAMELMVGQEKGGDEDG